MSENALPRSLRLPLDLFKNETRFTPLPKTKFFPEQGNIVNSILDFWGVHQPKVVDTYRLGLEKENRYHQVRTWGENNFCSSVNQLSGVTL